MTLEERIKKLESISCLERVGTQRWFKLKNTDVMFFINTKGVINWYEKGKNPIMRNKVSLQSVIETVREEIAEELIWNLNLL